MKLNLKNAESGDESTAPVPRTVRSNTELALAVNRGLAAALLNDLNAGFTTMRAGGVPMHVATRVLRNGAQHREADWKR